MQIIFLTFPCFAFDKIDSLFVFLLADVLSVFLLTETWPSLFGTAFLDISSPPADTTLILPRETSSELLWECSLGVFTRFSFFRGIGDDMGRTVSIPLFLDFLSNSRNGTTKTSGTSRSDWPCSTYLTSYDTLAFVPVSRSGSWV